MKIDLSRLSIQERRVLAELARGHSNKLIAYDLGLATSTVSTVLARIARKLGCTNRIELVRVGGTFVAHLPAQRGWAPEGRPLSQLTSTERDVAALVLRGQTTAQIAAARSVAIATVASQLQSIYRKLGIGSRAELACRLG